jgi:hypothetical protein
MDVWGIIEIAHVRICLIRRKNQLCGQLTYRLRFCDKTLVTAKSNKKE